VSSCFLWALHSFGLALGWDLLSVCRQKYLGTAHGNYNHNSRWSANRGGSSSNTVLEEKAEGEVNMSRTRIAGILISIMGILLLLVFLSTPINPSVTAGNLGLLAILLGVLVVGFDAFAKKAQLQGVPMKLTVIGWGLFSIGLLVGLAGFLLVNQVACSCPDCPVGRPCPCICGDSLYPFMIVVGITVAIIGVVILVRQRSSSWYKHGM
jgi:hypothetical protein